MSENQFQCGEPVRVTIDAEIYSDRTEGEYLEVTYTDSDNDTIFSKVPKSNVRHADVDRHKVPGRKVVFVRGLVKESYEGGVQETLEEVDRLVQEDVDHSPYTVFVIPEEFLDNALTVEYIGTRVSKHSDVITRSADSRD